MNKSLRVGIFGFYSYRNLGDNLMAFLIARHLQELGHKPLIFSKYVEDMATWDVPIYGDVGEFMGNCDIVFLGGGGLLIPRPRLSGMGLDFNEDLKTMLDLARTMETPLYGFSLGGAGVPLTEIVPQQRRDLIAQMKYVTLRNSEDLQLLKQAGIQGEFLDDIVWTVAGKIAAHRESKFAERYRVGINLYIGDSPKFYPTKFLLWLATKIRKDIRFIFFEIHPDTNNSFNAFYVNGSNCENQFAIDIEASCNAVASLDLLITTRLHLGVMAMSYGVPSVAYAAAVKTRLLYRRIGRQKFFWKSYEFYKFALLLVFPYTFKSTGILPPKKISENAQKHYDSMGRILAAHSQ